MSTLNQIIKFKLKKKEKKINAILYKFPQRRGTCVKILIRSPRKPNSAKRKVARVQVELKKKKIIILYCYIPGIGHNLVENSKILFNGGNVKDLPGVNHKIIRGVYECEYVKNRKRARSKYGSKKNENN